MCLGIPAKIISITDPENGIAQADIGGVKREINISLLALKGATRDELVGEYVLLHVGFAMAIIDQVEAQRSLNLLSQLQD